LCGRDFYIEGGVLHFSQSEGDNREGFSGHGAQLLSRPGAWLSILASLRYAMPSMPSQCEPLMKRLLELVMAANLAPMVTLGRDVILILSELSAPPQLPCV